MLLEYERSTTGEPNYWVNPAAGAAFQFASLCIPAHFRG